MDDLLKALAEAIRTGSQFAYPALIGYYITRVLETAIPACTVLGVAVIITRAIITGMQTGYHRMELELESVKAELRKHT